MILEYQQMYGPLPRCLGRVCRMAARPVAVDTPQETEPVANTDFVMIPMNQVPSQPTTQPVVFNQQAMVYQQAPQQPMVYQQAPQQSMVYQQAPQQSMVYQQAPQQPILLAQPQQFSPVQQPIPVVYAFPQQTGNMYPQNVQYQPAFVQQPIFAQPNVVVPKPNNGYPN